MSTECSSNFNVKINPKWWYLYGEAYDFSAFVDRHPGGQQAINLGRGRDTTALFESYHTNLPNKDYLEKYKVTKNGRDGEYPLKIDFEPFTFHDSGFYRTIKRKAKKYFEDTGYSPKGGFFDQIWWIVNFTTFMTCAYLAFVRGKAIPAIIFGISKSLLVIRATHACSHFSFSTQAWANRFVYWLNMAFLGDTPAQWTAKHVLAHHIDTNIVPLDDDTMYPIKRVLPSFQREWWHSYQHLYIWLLYTFVYYPWTLSHNIKVILGIVAGKIYEGTVEVRHEGSLDWIETISAIIIHNTLRLLPFFMLPFGNALVVAILSEMAGSLWFSLQFAVNHETAEACVFSDVAASLHVKDGKRDWGIHQVLTSHNYSADSWLALHLSGGLNCQIEHHLFPSVHYKYYKDLSKLVQETCKQFNIPYNASNTFFTGLVKHYQLLKKMGSQDKLDL